MNTFSYQGWRLWVFSLLFFLFSKVPVLAQEPSAVFQEMIQKDVSKKLFQDTVQNSLKESGERLRGQLQNTLENAKQRVTQRSFKWNDFQPYMETGGLWGIPGNSSRSWMTQLTLGSSFQLLGLPVDIHVSAQYNPFSGFDLGKSNLYQLKWGGLDAYKSKLSARLAAVNVGRNGKGLSSGLSSRLKQVYEDQLKVLEERVAVGTLLTQSGDEEKWPGKLLTEQMVADQVAGMEECLIPDSTGRVGFVQKINNFSAEDRKLMETILPTKRELEHLLTQSNEGIQRQFHIFESEIRSRASRISVDSLKKTAFLQVGLSRLAYLKEVVLNTRSDFNQIGLNEERLALLQKYMKHQLTDDQLEMAIARSFVPKRLSQSDFLQKISQLKTGSIGKLMPGNMFNRELFMKGFDLDFRLGGRAMQIGAGKREDQGSFKDSGFEGSGFSSSKIITYFSSALYQSREFSGKVSIVHSSTSQSSQFAAAVGAPRQNFSVSLNQDMTLKKWGRLSVELSRASNAYSNGSIQVSELNFVRTDALSSFFTSNFDQSLSVGIRHDFSIERLGMRQSLYFNYAGIGYQHPGSSGGLNTRTRFGGNLRKEWLKRKLIIQARGDFRHTPISYNGDDAWRSYQFQGDATFRVGRRTSIRMNYNNSNTDRKSISIQPAFASQKIQVGVQSGYQLLKNSAFTYINVGHQDFTNYGEVILRSHFLTLNLSQTVQFGKTPLMAGIFYNKEVADVKLMGDMLNADLSLQLVLAEKWLLNPGMTYLNNKGVARQVGIKSGMQFTATKRLSMSASADFRKDLMESLYPQLYTRYRGEFTLTYYLNGKK